MGAVVSLGGFYASHPREFWPLCGGIRLSESGTEKKHEEKAEERESRRDCFTGSRGGYGVPPAHTYARTQIRVHPPQTMCNSFSWMIHKTRRTLSSVHTRLFSARRAVHHSICCWLEALHDLQLPARGNAGQPTVYTEVAGGWLAGKRPVALSKSSTTAVAHHSRTRGHNSVSTHAHTVGGYLCLPQGRTASADFTTISILVLCGISASRGLCFVAWHFFQSALDKHSTLEPLFSLPFHLLSLSFLRFFH